VFKKSNFKISIFKENKVKRKNYKQKKRKTEETELSQKPIPEKITEIVTENRRNQEKPNQMLPKIGKNQPESVISTWAPVIPPLSDF
jgi:hypothetical protein